MASVCAAPAAHAVYESCLLCGTILSTLSLKRRKRVKQLKQYLANHIEATEFVWRYAMNTCNAERDERRTIALCMPCTHWLTRRVNKHGTKLVLPMDSLITFCCAPFSFEQPDQRFVNRLASMLNVEACVGGTRYRNPYTAFFTEGMLACFERAMATECAGNVVDAIVQQWWSQAGHTFFVTERALARHIRRACKEEVERQFQSFMSIAV